MHDDIYTRQPINRTAALVTGQRFVTDEPMCREEKIELLNRMRRKQNLIKQLAGIRNRVHHQNIKKRFHARGGFDGNNPRLLKEYFANGLSMEAMCKEMKS